jgi:hypothetical protein
VSPQEAEGAPLLRGRPDPGPGPSLTRPGRGEERARRGGAGPQLTGVRGIPRRDQAEAETEAQREGAREGPPRAHGKAREPPPLSEPPSSLRAPGDGRGDGRHDGKFLGTGNRVQI